MIPKNPLLQKCIVYLESLPNIQACLQGEFYYSSEVLADGKLSIDTPNGTINYVCEIKTGLISDVVEQVAEYIAYLAQKLDSQERPLLITSDLSNQVINQLLEKNIEFIDVEGNIYLNAPGLYLLTRNQNQTKSLKDSLRITLASLQIIYTLLYQSKNFNNYGIDQQVLSIASFTGITQRTVKSILKKLKELDYLEYIYNHYQIKDYIKLFERWEFGYAEILREKFLIGAFNPISQRQFSDIIEELKDKTESYNYLIGGELAASIITDYLRPISASLYLNKEVNYRQLMVDLKLKPDPQGSVFFFKSFGNKYEDRIEYPNYSYFSNQGLADPLLIHAELSRTNDSRLKETAKLIYKKYIKELIINV